MSKAIGVAIAGMLGLAACAGAGHRADRATAATAPATVAGAGVTEAGVTGAGRMQDMLHGCAAKRARITLVEEAMMTRTAVTPETADQIGEVTVLEAGDHRLARLSELLRALEPQPGHIAAPEIRLVVRLDCESGEKHVITGSRTGAGGTIDLLIDGQPASTNAPLRRELEALVG